MWDDLTLPAVVTPLDVALRGSLTAATPAVVGEETARAALQGTGSQ